MGKYSELLTGFAKGGDNLVKRRITKNALVYTRVSSKRQEDNMSLDTQLKIINEYVEKHSYNVVEYFGGTYESADSDERREFIKMMKCAKSSKHKISTIIVFKYDRFSRTGPNAIYLSHNLKEMGISVISVTEPINLENPSGELHQGMIYLFAQFENNTRRERCVLGMKEKLLKGEWIGKAPEGYEYSHESTKKDQKIVFNRDSVFIKKIFKLKVDSGLSHVEIAKELNSANYPISDKQISKILRNPFYCGYVTQKILDGKIVKGKHPALISEMVFLEANELLKKNRSGFKHKKQIDEIPLKRHLKCTKCNNSMTGYIAAKNKQYYYKCNTKGCSNNRRANDLHDKFRYLIQQYEIKEAFKEVIMDQLLNLYHALAESKIDEKKSLAIKLADLQVKLDTVEENFALNKISFDVFEKISKKFQDEMKPIQEDIQKLSFKLSNPQELIEYNVQHAINLAFRWETGDHYTRTKLQNLIFPEGIYYDRKLDEYRTQNVNIIFEVIQRVSENIIKKKGDSSLNIFELSPSVERKRFELSVQLPAHTLSKRAPSATRTPLSEWECKENIISPLIQIFSLVPITIGRVFSPTITLDICKILKNNNL